MNTPHIALSRRYRPQSFEDVSGQSFVLGALKRSLESNRIHHCYLFSGTRGIGKTTLARIFAKSLNCLSPLEGVACGSCEHCRESEQGTFVDLIEIDAASNTKVEDTRALLDQVPYLPSKGRMKVYLIDEVHMLSKHSFNALLKTLEEPPSHVKFLLATTDPERLPATIISRALHYRLVPFSAHEIQKRLVHILQKEGIKFDESALLMLATAARGSMRDALSLLDQAIVGTQTINEDAIASMLGVQGEGFVFDIVQNIMEGKLEDALLRFRSTSESESIDAPWFLDQLLGAFKDLSILKMMPDAVHLIANPSFASLRETLEKVDTTTLQLYYDITIKAKKDLPLSQNSDASLEMNLIRLVAFSPISLGKEAQMLADQKGTQEMPTPSERTEKTTPAVPPQPPEPPKMQAFNQAPTPTTKPTTKTPQDEKKSPHNTTSDEKRGADTPPKALEAKEATSRHAPKPASSETSPQANASFLWHDALASLSGLWQSLLADSVLKHYTPQGQREGQREGHALHVHFSPEAWQEKKELLEMHQAKLEAHFAEHFFDGKKTKLFFETGAVAKDETFEAKQSAQTQKLREDFLSNEAVQVLVKEGAILESIAPKTD